MEQPKLKLRDFREPRDWRLWQEHAGFFIPECPCCGELVTIRKLYGLTTAGGTPPPPAPTTGGKEIWSEDTWQPVLDTALDSAGNVIAVSFGAWDRLYWADPPTNSILGHQIIFDTTALVQTVFPAGGYDAKIRFVINGNPDTGTFTLSWFDPNSITWKTVGNFDTNITTDALRTALEAVTGFPVGHYKLTGSLKAGWQLEIENASALYLTGIGAASAALGTSAWNVSRAHPRNVSKWDPDGKLLWEHDFQGYDCRCVVIDSNDNVIAGGNRLIKYDPDGNVIWSKSPGTIPALYDTLGNLVNPAMELTVVDLAVDSNDNVFGTHGKLTHAMAGVTVVVNRRGSATQSAQQTLTVKGPVTGFVVLTANSGLEDSAYYSGAWHPARRLSIPCNATALQVQNAINTGITYLPYQYIGSPTPPPNYTGPFDPKGTGYNTPPWTARPALQQVTCTGGPWPTPIVVNWINNWANMSIGNFFGTVHCPMTGNSGADSNYYWGYDDLSKWDSSGDLVWRRGVGTIGSIAVNANDEVIVGGAMSAMPADSASGYANMLSADSTWLYQTPGWGSLLFNPFWYTLDKDGIHHAPANLRKMSNDGEFLVSRVVAGSMGFHGMNPAQTTVNDADDFRQFYGGNGYGLSGSGAITGLALRGNGNLYVSAGEITKFNPLQVSLTTVGGAGTNAVVTLRYNYNRDIAGDVESGTFKIFFDPYRITDPIPFNTGAAGLEAAINACLGAGAVSVTVTAGSGAFTGVSGNPTMSITFIGAGYEHKRIDDFNVGIEYEGIVWSKSAGYLLTTQATAGYRNGITLGATNHYARTIHPLRGPIGGTWTMTKQGITTSPIPWDATKEAIAAACNAVWPNPEPAYPFKVVGGPLPAGAVLIMREQQVFGGPTITNLRLDLITIDNTQLYCRSNVLCLDQDTLDTNWGIYVQDNLTDVAVDDHERAVVGSAGLSVQRRQGTGPGTDKTVYRFDPTGIELWHAHNGDYRAGVNSVAVTADGERVWTGTARSDKHAVVLFKM